MNLSDTQIEFIIQDLEERGITMEHLADDLVDHICCVLEKEGQKNFYEAYYHSLQAFGAEGIKKIQEQTVLLLTLKNRIIMKGIMYILGYVSAALISSGALFKLQHWPFAGILITLGIVVLNFGFLPMYFYNRYKSSISQ